MHDPLRLDHAAVELRKLARLGLREDSAPRRAGVVTGMPVLWSLPAVVAAGSSSTARFEYLVQAVVDAVDAMGANGGRTGLEAQALRILFGLTSGGRRLTWQARQQAAAAELAVSYDQFRRRIQEPLLRVIAERLLEAAQESTRTLDGGLVGVASQVELESEFVDHIRGQVSAGTPREALLLELSTATIGELLDALRDTATPVRLLVADPYKATATWQQERMWMTLVHRLQHDFGDHPGLEMRIYSTPPGLRGRIIGDLVAVGWYTHRDNKRLDATDPAADEVWGHDNALVAGRTDKPDGAVLASWFRREFDRLWHNRLTVGGTAMRRLLGLAE